MVSEFVQAKDRKAGDWIVPMAFIIGFLCLMAGASAETANGCYDGTSGALLRWTFDDADLLSATTLRDKCDSVGFNNTVTAAGGVTTGVAGKWGQAWSRDAINDQIYNSDANSDAHYAVTNDFTVTIWVNPTAFGGGTMVYFNERYGGTNGHWLLRPEPAGTTTHYAVGSGGGFAGGTFATANTVGAWTFLALTYNGTNKTECLYVNGTFRECNSAVLVGNLYSASSYTTIGYEHDVADRYWTNMVADEARIYNYSLAPAAIANLYNINALSCSPSFTPTSAPVGEIWEYTDTGSCPGATNYYWDFNNDGVVENTGSPTSYTYASTGVKTVNYTVTAGGTNTSVLVSVTVANRPTANFSIGSSTPYMVLSSIQFNDTSTSTGGYIPMTAWAWTFNDTNTSAVQNATNTFVMPGYYYVCLNVSDSLGLWANTSYCSNTTINGLALDVFDEATLAAIPSWNVTFSNSTYSQSFTSQANTFTWSNFTNFPIGSLTISVSASGYVGRTYYRTYNLNTPLSFDAYLLDTSSGVYSYFTVQDAYGTNLQDVWLVFTYTLGGTTYTVGEAMTDSTGSATMWLDWTKTHVVTAEKTGYTTVSKSFIPQPTTYLIIMGSASLFNYTYLNSSLWTFIDPLGPEVNETTDSITAGVLDPDSGITICGLNLTEMDGTVFHSHTNLVEQHYCTNTIPLLGSGVAGMDKFRALLWYTQNGTTANASRTYTVVGTTSSSLTDASSGLLNDLGGEEARLMLAVIVTLFAGAASAAYVGSGAVLIMIAVSGMFFYWGWFAATPAFPYLPLLYFIAVMGGLAALYLEQRV